MTNALQIDISIIETNSHHLPSHAGLAVDRWDEPSTFYCENIASYYYLLFRSKLSSKYVNVSDNYKHYK